MKPEPEVGPEDLPDRNSGATPQCLVLGCSGKAEQVWTDVTVETRNHLATWPVCHEHYLRLRAGEAWAGVTGGPQSYRRWMLMGDDVTTQPPPHPHQRPRLTQPDEPR